MRHRTLPLASLLALLVLSCQTNTPTSPLDGGVPHLDEPASELPLDGQDEGLRDLTAILTGDLKLKGSVTMPVGYVDSPAIVTQPASTGELALVRLRAVASDATTNRTIYSDIRGPGGAYSSQTLLSDNTSQYKALYVLRNEELSVRVHNRPSFSGTLNSPAADVNYTFETKPIEDSSEPNDDENTSTISDRLSGKALGLGTTATRSFFEYSASVKDREDWYTTTLQAGANYRYKLTSYNPRYGTWGYTLKLYNAAGTQVGSTTTIPVGNAAGNLQTPAISTTGTYYLQITGTPGTKSNNSNVFYSLYGINVCQQSIAGTPVFTPSSGTQLCPGSTGTWNASTTPLATAFSWNFGGGATPNTSTSANPPVTLTSNGTYNGTLTTTSACGAQIIKAFSYTVGCNSWGRSVGSSVGAFDDARINQVLVDASNRVHAIATYDGGEYQFTVQEPGGTKIVIPSEFAGSAYFLLNPEGALIRAFPLFNQQSPRVADLDLTSDGDLRLVGSFRGSVDFDPGPGTLLKSTVAEVRDGFVMGLTSTGALQWAHEFDCGGSEDEETRMHDLIVGSGNVLDIGGEFFGPTDFDPGPGTQIFNSDGNDGVRLALTDAGAFINAASITGSQTQRVTQICADKAGGFYLAGQIFGTATFLDANPLVRTSAGSSDAFLARYSASRALQWVSHWGGTSTEEVSHILATSTGQPRVVGRFYGTADFDPGAGEVSRTAASDYNDSFLLALTGSSGSFGYVNVWGGTLGEDPAGFALNPINGDLAVLGEFAGTVDFDPGSGTAIRSATSPTDLFLSVFTSGGSLRNVSIWNATQVLDTDQPGNMLGVGADGRLVLGTSFSETIDLDPGLGSVPLSNIGRRNGLVLRLLANGTYF